MMETTIGLNAGNIIALLSQGGKLSLRELGEKTNCKDSVIFISIGWLFRENKISITEDEDRLFFELRHPENIWY